MMATSLSLSGPLNRSNAILSLLHPLNSYRTASGIVSAIGRSLSRPVSHPRAGGTSQPPHPKPLRGLNRAIVVLQCLNPPFIRDSETTILIKFAFWSLSGRGKIYGKLSQNAIFPWKFHDNKIWKFCEFYCQKFCCHLGGSYFKQARKRNAIEAAILNHVLNSMPSMTGQPGYRTIRYEWRKFRAVPRLYPLRSLVLYFL